MPPPPIPVALTIAGSDCSGGAGIQADLKTFLCHGVHGLSALTCAVSESSRIVEAIEPLPPGFLASQIRLMLAEFPVAAIKTGMLFSGRHVEAVLESLDGTAAPVVVDPVMIASTGAPLIEEDAITLYKDRLLPRASLITPNLDEAAVLLDGLRITRANLRQAARSLHARYATAVLLKGGHLGDDRATDILVATDGTVTEFESAFLPSACTHGTGCTYSAAITAGLACGNGLVEAVGAAKKFIQNAISNACQWPATGTGVVGSLSFQQLPAIDLPS